MSDTNDLISRQAAKEKLLSEGLITAAILIDNLPQAEKIVKCNECKHWILAWIPALGEGHYCPIIDNVMLGDEWCCYGERKNDENV